MDKLFRARLWRAIGVTLGFFWLGIATCAAHEFHARKMVHYARHEAASGIARIAML